jgi:hypothetical protein
VPVQILKEVRARYKFALIGYVTMPEHMHLLISERRVARRILFSSGHRQHGHSMPLVYRLTLGYNPQIF